MVLFCLQQAAEKAVKSLLQKQGFDPWGHSIYQLLQVLESDIDGIEELFEDAKLLDKLYIPTRYPHGFASGSPMDYYTNKDAKNAINSAEVIINFVSNKIELEE